MRVLYNYPKIEIPARMYKKIILAILDYANSVENNKKKFSPKLKINENKKITDILFWRGVPGRASVHNEAIIAKSLELHGINTKFVICDGILSGCIQRKPKDNISIGQWKKDCLECVFYGIKIFRRLKIPYLKMSDYTSNVNCIESRKIAMDTPVEGITGLKYGEIPVGQFAASSFYRYLKGKSEIGYESILREYLYSSLLCTKVAENILKTERLQRIFMQGHIQYVEWAPAYMVYTGNDMPVTLWSRGPAPEMKIVLRNVNKTEWSHIWSITDEQWKRVKQEPLTIQKDTSLDGVLFPNCKGKLNSRSVEMINKLGNNEAISKEEKIRTTLNLTKDKPIWCVFTQMTWDAGFNPEIIHFKDVLSWIIITVETILKIKDVHWLIKVHPGEQRGTEIGVAELIKKTFPEIDNELTIIPADTDILLHDLIPALSGGVTIQGTVGIQLPCLGIPVIVSAKTHYSGKGFTYDGYEADSYIKLLKNVKNIKMLNDEQMNNARKYAYSLFFNRRFPLVMTKNGVSFSPLDPKKEKMILPGKNHIIDMICDNILNDGVFEIPDQNVASF